MNVTLNENDKDSLRILNEEMKKKLKMSKFITKDINQF